MAADPFTRHAAALQWAQNVGRDMLSSVHIPSQSWSSGSHSNRAHTHTHHNTSHSCLQYGTMPCLFNPCVQMRPWADTPCTTQSAHDTPDIVTCSPVCTLQPAGPLSAYDTSGMPPFTECTTPVCPLHQAPHNPTPWGACGVGCSCGWVQLPPVYPLHQPPHKQRPTAAQQLRAAQQHMPHLRDTGRPAVRLQANENYPSWIVCVPMQATPAKMRLGGATPKHPGQP
jgi:hypothetical protein